MLEIQTLPVTELVPHAGSMSLLQQVIAADENSLTARVSPANHGLFNHHGQIGAWLGIEYMAQAIAAWAGWQQRQKSAQPKIGLLLGTRRYTTSQATFSPHDQLTVTIQRIFQAENGLGQFDCQILADDVCIASAALTVFEPDDPESFLKLNTNA